MPERARPQGRHPLQTMQRTLGNRAVTALLSGANRPSARQIQRACACEEEQTVARLVDDVALARPACADPEHCECAACKAKRQAQPAAVSSEDAVQRACATCEEESLERQVDPAGLQRRDETAGEATGEQPAEMDPAAVAASPEASAAAAASAPPGPMVCNLPAECPPEFCTPYPAWMPVSTMRDNMAPILLAGIAVKVNPRVVGLWSSYLFGGSSARNLSGQFGADFTTSRTTRATTDFLLRELRRELTANPPAIPAGDTRTTIDIPSTIPAAINEIRTPDAANEMNFDVIEEIPGNIAGGIGRTQTSCPVGAQPGPFDDDRIARGTATITRLPNGNLFVVPSIQYTVFDTIDLCPGNCGAEREQVATIPLSRFEASGVSGDMPFEVNFPGLAAPFIITPAAPAPPPPGPQHGTTTASALRIREQPNTSSPILGRYPRGTQVELICQVVGTEVDGNNIWNQTDQGYISDRYVQRESGAVVPDC